MVTEEDFRQDLQQDTIVNANVKLSTDVLLDHQGLQEEMEYLEYPEAKENLGDVDFPESSRENF